MSKLFTLGGNGQFARSGDNPEFSIKAKGSVARAGLAFDLNIAGDPESLCAMLYTAMSSYPEMAKVFLTVNMKFCQDKGITADKLIEHTYFKK